MDRATPQFKVAKKSAHSLLGLQPSEKVLDVGCGTGDGVRDLGVLVEPGGVAFGVDKSKAMIEEAHRRSVGCGLPVQFAVSEAEKLPWPSGYFDACLADRLLQHLEEPAQALDEMARVLKFGGRIVVVDRDWDRIAIDAADSATTRSVLGRASAGIRNPWVGRQLGELFRNAGLVELDVQYHEIPISGFEVADALLDLRTVTAHAISENLVTHRAGMAWLADLMERDSAGTFFASITLCSAFGKKP